MDNTYKIVGIDLFSGIGGIGLALQDYVRTVAYCEIEPYCRAVLMSRMSTGHLDYAPIWVDIKSLDGRQFEGEVDIIFGGFPCQGISVAGAGKGLEDERSGLFYEILRLAEEIKPTFIFLENTKGILSNGGLQVVEAIAGIGYDCRWITKNCREVGSPQNRERWFCLAHSNSKGNKRLSSREKAKESKFRINFKSKKWDEWPSNESPLLRMDDDVSFRMDKVRALGNSVCIEQAKEAFKELMGLT